MKPPPFKKKPHLVEKCLHDYAWSVAEGVRDELRKLLARLRGGDGDAPPSSATCNKLAEGIRPRAGPHSARLGLRTALTGLFYGVVNMIRAKCISPRRHSPPPIQTRRPPGLRNKGPNNKALSD